MTTTDSVVDLIADPDLQSLMDEIVSEHSGADVEPDPRAVWDTLVEAGLARLTGPEADGGSGAGWTEAAALLRTFAAAGVAVPYAETDLLAGPLRRAAELDDTSQATATVAVLGADGSAHRVPWAGATESVVCVRRTPQGYEIADVPTADLDVHPTPAVSAVPTGSITPPPRRRGLAWPARRSRSTS